MRFFVARMHTFIVSVSTDSGHERPAAPLPERQALKFVVKQEVNKMAETKANDFLEKESLGKLMVKYCIPCVIALLVATLYNIVDQIFISNASYLGVDGVAASTYVFPLTVIALGLGMMIGDGCSTFASISLGAKETDKARRGVGTAILSLVTLGIVLMIIYLVFPEQLLGLFGATKENAKAMEMGKEYLFWIALGIPFYVFSQALNPVIRSDGSPRFAMATLLLGGVINIILDPIFIFVLKWGMKGAAIATILGQIVSALLFLSYLFRMKAIKLNRDSFHFRGRILTRMMRIGMGSLLTQVSICLSMAVVQTSLTKYGALDPIFSQEGFQSIPVAVFGIVIKYFQIVMSVAIGLSTGIIPIAGYNIGAKRYDRVLQLLKRLLMVEAIVGVIATVIFMGFPYQLTALFGGNSAADAAVNEAYLNYAVKFMRVFMCCLILSCCNKGHAIFQQAIGRATTATVLSMMREVVFGISMPLIMPIFFGLDGIPYFMPVSDVFATIVAICVITYTVRMLRRKQNEVESGGAVTERHVPANPSARGVITIGRSYGAGGRSVGKLVAETLNIPYYDSELLEQAAIRSGLNQKYLESVDEKSVKLGALYHYAGLAYDPNSELEMTAARAQREIIEKVADEGACVIVGRRADQILSGKKDLFRVFVTAPIEARADRVAGRENLSQQESVQKIKKVDKERSAYYNQNSDQEWGEASNYDLCVDTDKLGVQGAADLIAAAVQKLRA